MREEIINRNAIVTTADRVSAKLKTLAYMLQGAYPHNSIHEAHEGLGYFLDELSEETKEILSYFDHRDPTPKPRGRAESSNIDKLQESKHE